MNLKDFIKQYNTILDNVGIANANFELTYLISETLNIDIKNLYLNDNIILSQKQKLKLIALIKERLKGKPLDRVLNIKYFRDIILKLNKNVFSPRIDTEFLIDIIVTKKISPKNILELGTGSGCIIISLLKEFSNSIGLATDIKLEAIYIAKKNAILNNVFNRVDFLCSNWLNAIGQLSKFDLIISNPPYIKSGEIKGLDPEVSMFDPLPALDGGEDGLFAYRSIIEKLEKLEVRKDTKLLFEIGYDQASDVEALMRNANFRNIETFKDYEQNYRCVIGSIK